MSQIQPVTRRLFETEVYVIAGDIAALDRRVDAIVSSDDNYLTHGGGVSAALWQVGGPVLDEWFRSGPGDVALGDVVVGPAGALRANALIHAITVDYDANEAVGFSEAVRLYGRILDEAADRDWHSVATPVLGTGVSALDPEASAAALRSALRERRLDANRPRAVIVVTNPAYPQAFERVVAVLERASTDSPSPADRVRNATELDAESRQVLLDAWDAGVADKGPGAAEQLFTVSLLLLDQRIASPATNQHATASPQVPLAAVFQSIEDGYRRRGSDVSAAVMSAYQTGVVARNRVIHQRAVGVARRNLRRTLLKAAEELIAAILSPTEITAPIDALSGTDLDPIHALQQFVLTHSAKADRNMLLEQLRQSGYVGTDETCLLEYCLRVSPLDILQDNFTVHRLRAYVTAGGQQIPPDEGIGKVASRVLQTFGFRVERLPASPRKLRNGIVGALAKVDLLNSAELRGCITGFAVDLESCLQHFLRFFCRSALQVDANLWALHKGVVKLPTTLAKASLGTLLAALDRLADDIASLDGPLADDFARDFGANVAIPRGYTQIAAYRNEFVHAHESRPQNSMSEHTAARKFLLSAQKLLDDLLRSDTTEPLFPRIIQVTLITDDEWGRRLIHAKDDQGRDEVIFTTQPVDAGRVYLMHPLSNPLRVDPILIPVGDSRQEPASALD